MSQLERNLTAFQAAVPRSPDDPRSADFTMELNEFRHSSGRLYINFKFSRQEGIMSASDARTYAEVLLHFADQLEGVIPKPVPPPPSPKHS